VVQRIILHFSTFHPGKTLVCITFINLINTARLSIKYFSRVSCILLLLFISCKTYIIPVESFKDQLSGIDSTKLIPVQVSSPTGQTLNYLANPLRNIQCIDKNKNTVKLTNSPSLELRITYNKRKRTIFYFDRVVIINGQVTGVRSRLIPSLRKSIPLNDISKIEIQNGRKNYRYINR